MIEREPGTRTRWKVAVLEGEREVWATTGRGPLGRLRARARAERWALERGQVPTAETVGEDVDPWPRSLSVAVSRCLNRLRFEGVIE